MSFLPTFNDWQAIELVGYGGYGRVFRCNRKESASSASVPAATQNQSQQEQLLLVANNDESSLSPSWYPKTVAVKMIQYVREPAKDKDQKVNWQQAVDLFARNKNNNNNNNQNNNRPQQGAGIGDLITHGLEGLKEAAALLSTGTHPNLIRLDSCFYSLKYKSLCLVEEWADGPTLGDIYSQVGALSEKAMTAVILDMLHGLLHLHSCRIIHRDIKPTNILANTRTGVSKIADLGVSALRPEIGDYRKTYCGTAGFLAPEVAARNNNNNDNNNNINNIQPVVQDEDDDDDDNSDDMIDIAHQQERQRVQRLANLQQAWGPMSARAANHLASSGQGYNESADIWSMGITLLEGAIGQVQAHQYVAKIFNAYTVEEESACRRAVLRGLPPRRNQEDFFHVTRKNMENKMKTVFHCGAEMTDLLLSMLDPIPSRRPTCQWLLTKHPFCVKALEKLCGGDEETKESNNNPSVSSSPSSSSVTAITLNYVKNHDRDAKEFRKDIIEAIQRVPRKRVEKQNNLLNPLEVFGSADENNNNNNAMGESPDWLERNAFRSPKQNVNSTGSTCWTLPSSKLIDVVCGLDFPTSSSPSTSKFTIGLEDRASLFLPANPKKIDCDEKVIRTTSKPEEFAEASSKRIHFQVGTSAIAKMNVKEQLFNKLLKNNEKEHHHRDPQQGFSSSSTTDLPFGDVFQQLISPSLDSAMVRSVRLDSWLDGVPLSIPTPSKRRFEAVEKQILKNNYDGDDSYSSESSDSDNDRHDLAQTKTYESGEDLFGENKKKHQEQDDDINNNNNDDDNNIISSPQQPLYFWPTNSSPEANTMSMMQQQHQKQPHHLTASSSQALRQKELDAFHQLKSAITECEAIVPNFSETFFSSLADATAADSGTCALVSHAFDRGQGFITRHRDAKAHGFSLMATTPANNNNQQKSSATGNNKDTTTTNKDNVSVASPVSSPNYSNFTQPPPSNILMTGRKPASRTGTPRLTTTGNHQTIKTSDQLQQQPQAQQQQDSSTSTLASPTMHGGNDNTKTYLSPSSRASPNNNNPNTNPNQSSSNTTQQPKKPPPKKPVIVVANSNANMSSPSIISQRNPFAPTTNSSIMNATTNTNPLSFHQSQQYHHPSASASHQQQQVINTARMMNTARGGTSNNNPNSAANTTANLSSPLAHANTNSNNNVSSSTPSNSNNNIINQAVVSSGPNSTSSGGNNINSNSSAASLLLNREAWNVSVPDGTCQSLNVFSSIVNNNNNSVARQHHHHHRQNHRGVDEQFIERYSFASDDQGNKNNNNNNNNNKSNKKDDRNDNNDNDNDFIADGVTRDGQVYSSELLFGCEAQKYHQELVRNLKQGRL